MRARPSKTRRRIRTPRKQSLQQNLLLLFLSLMVLAGASSLFYMATSQHLYQPLQWRINKLAEKAPEQVAQKKTKQESPKLAASGMEYLFWEILREERPATNP